MKNIILAMIFCLISNTLAQAETATLIGSAFNTCTNLGIKNVRICVYDNGVPLSCASTKANGAAPTLTFNLPPAGDVKFTAFLHSKLARTTIERPMNLVSAKTYRFKFYFNPKQSACR